MREEIKQMPKNKLLSEVVSANLRDIFNNFGINIKISDSASSFKIDKTNDFKPKDIHDVTTLHVIRYLKFKYNINDMDKADKLARLKISIKIRDRAEKMLENYAKEMVQVFGKDISDKRKHKLFTKISGLSNATVFKFSKLNINGQQSFLKKLGIGVEFFEEEGTLVEIEIHKFGYKHI